MASVSRRSNFPQLGGEGERYQQKTRAGEPKFTKAGNPEMTWKFPYADLGERSSRLAATANFVHSIESAPASAVEHGKMWYPAVNEAVRKGIRKRGFLSGAQDKVLSGSGLVAAVSPNMDWDRNNIDAMGELASLKSHHWDAIMNASNAPKSRQAVADAVQGMSISATPVHNLQRAGRLVRGEDPNVVMNKASGPKTHHFMHNIADPSNPHFVTIDGRAFDTLTNRMRPWDVGRGIGGSVTNKQEPKRYQQAVGIVQNVAHAMDIDPSAAQGISWSHTKYEIEQGGGTRKQGPARTGQPYFHPKTGAPVALAHLSGQFRG